jgi:hypothetical protein
LRRSVSRRRSLNSPSGFRRRASAVGRVTKMPRFSVRSSNEVPQPTRASKAVQEARRQYEGYIREIGNNIGELEILPGERVRSVKVRLRRAATRIRSELDIWDIDDRVYFRVRPKRGRPRK